jgi:hypothetical protein
MVASDAAEQSHDNIAIGVAVSTRGKNSHPGDGTKDDADGGIRSAIGAHI